MRDFRHRGTMTRRLLLLLPLLLVSACSQSGPKPLRIGMDMSYPPFEMRDTAGQPSGVSVDLARALGESLGRKVEFENMPFDGLIPALKTVGIKTVVNGPTPRSPDMRPLIGPAHGYDNFYAMCGVSGGFLFSSTTATAAK